jgi:hypothetical protein
MTTPKTENGAAVALDAIVRPSTRGELAQRLKAGEACEVVEYVSEMTANLLRGWLEVDNFNVEISLNPGWVVFRPNASHQPPDEGGLAG